MATIQCPKCNKSTQLEKSSNTLNAGLNDCWKTELRALCKELRLSTIGRLREEDEPELIGRLKAVQELEIMQCRTCLWDLYVVNGQILKTTPITRRPSARGNSPPRMGSYCERCGNSWHPAGTDRKCPKCGWHPYHGWVVRQ